MVRAAGFEPAKPKPKDFKSFASTDFATLAIELPHQLTSKEQYCQYNNSNTHTSDELASVAFLVQLSATIVAAISPIAAIKLANVILAVVSELRH
jgi:hypothetical protein